MFTLKVPTTLELTVGLIPELRLGLERTVQRFCIHKDGAAFLFEFDHGSSRRNRWLLEVQLFKLLHGLDCQLRQVIEEVLPEVVAIQMTERRYGLLSRN